MADGRFYDGIGAQAYRWVMIGGMAIVSALSLRVLGQIDKTAEKVEILQLQVTDIRGTFNLRMEGHVERLNMLDRRNEQQDLKLSELERMVWRGFNPLSAPPAHPQPQPQRTPPPPAILEPTAPSIRVYPP
jgi:hypothetical protein